MILLLTILSVLAVWALLAVLIIGLLLILKPLESIRARLERIAMGVRAIERETMPLSPRVDALAASLNQANSTVSATARRLTEAAPDLQS